MSKIKKNKVEKNEYTYPIEIYEWQIKTAPEYGPFGTQWVHDPKQVNDPIDQSVIKKTVIFEKLRQIISPEQGTDEWLNFRKKMITASDGGCIVGVNKYEPRYKFILKKVLDPKFSGGKACYHGKKYETIANMLYEYRFNVTVEEFGLLEHEKYKFLGASPDGIIGKYKNDQKHLTKYVGRMLEIKCPASRIIKTYGSIYDICPIYYWVQVQLQLECCDLDQCDFWQCKILEYPSRDSFIKDTNPMEPHLSIKTGFEKGCLIQLIHKSKMSEVINGNYDQAVYDKSSFLYPPKINMTPLECDIWISQTISNFPNHEKASEYYIDRVIYWKISKTHCLTIDRDRVWFAEKLPIFEKMWNYVIYFRQNVDKMNLIKKLTDHVEMVKIDYDEKIIDLIDTVYKNDLDVEQLTELVDQEISLLTNMDEAQKEYEHLIEKSQTSSSLFDFSECAF